MATIPSTLVVYSKVKVNFPIKTALVVMKQLFQYGVKEIVPRGNELFISLTYSPRAKTLKNKFGNLPVKYMRAKIDNEEDFKILESVVKRYKFNLVNEELEDLDRKRIEAPPSSSQGYKRKRYLEIPDTFDPSNDFSSSDGEVDEELRRILNVESGGAEKKVRSSGDEGASTSKDLPAID